MVSAVTRLKQVGLEIRAPNPTWRFWIWVALVVAVLAGSCWWIWLLRGPFILARGSTLILGQVLVGMGIVAIAGLIYSTPADAIKLRPRTSWWLIVGGTVMLHSLAVLLLWPALSDEVVRYRIDGLAWLSGRSPYSVTPRELLATGQMDVIDRSTPFLDARTTHGPVAQTLFITTRAIEMAAFGNATVDTPHAMRSYRWRDVVGHVSFHHRGFVLRLVFATAAVCCTLLLIQLLQHRHLTPWLAVLFAWNPLIVLETGAMGHVDIVGILLVLAMLRMLQKRKPSLATLALCLACGVKPLLIVLSPVLIRQIAGLRDWKIAQRSIGLAVLTLVFVYIPILSIQHGHAGWIGQAQANVQQVEGNGGLYHFAVAVASHLGENIRALTPAMMRWVPLLVLLGALLWLLRRKSPMEDAGYWLMLCPMLVMPAVEPWHLLWPLCFVPVMRHSSPWTALTWSATIGFAYVPWYHAASADSARILLAEYLPVAVAFGLQITETLRRPQIHRPVDATTSA